MAGSKTPVVVKAIWDTGAYGSVISPKVARELGLIPVGVKPIETANGTYEAYAYVVDMMLPNKLVIRGVEVSESDLKVCDALIGMDVISMGDMKVTNKPTTKFIFRIPAEGRHDGAGGGAGKKTTAVLFAYAVQNGGRSELIHRGGMLAFSSRVV